MNEIAPGAHANRHRLRRFPEDSGIPEISLKSLRSFNSGILEERISTPNEQWESGKNDAKRKCHRHRMLPTRSGKRGNLVEGRGLAPLFSRLFNGTRAAGR
jgi:hypothetical protein